MFHKVFGFLEHTNNCYIFSISFQNDRNETKLTCNQGFRWIAGSTSIDLIRRPGVLADLDPLDLDPPVQIRWRIWTPRSKSASVYGLPGPNPLADLAPPPLIWTTQQN